MPRVGVLSYQGDFQRHSDVLALLGLEVQAVRAPEHLAGISGLVVPGGESTTIGMLMERFGLLGAIRGAAKEGLPIFGTCAGAILLAKEIEGSQQPRLGLMDIHVSRNAYGRQIESFEAELEVSSDLAVREASSEAGASPGASLGASPDASPRPLTGVFIRAPIITALGEGVRVLASFEEHPVLVAQGQFLAATFHPELTGDTRVHRLFSDMVTEYARR